jgi:hypothetical protein
MAEARLNKEDANKQFSGDYVKVDGTLTATGIVTTTAGVARVKVSTTADVGGTKTGAFWTTGPPLLTDGQRFLLVTCGSTDYRIPLWLTA